MTKKILRREFLTASGLGAAALFLGGTAMAAPSPEALRGLVEVDQNLFLGINRGGDPAKRSVLEKKHAPVIEAPATVKAGEPFAVTVTVGEIIHPMGAAHYIEGIELFAGNEPAGRVLFSAELSLPQATFHLKLAKGVTLVARQYCNLHGLWESRLDLKVT